MRVSVVVPVYNPGPYIADLLDSLRAQTLDPADWEAVLVDDGSTDGTPALLDRVAAETPGIRVIHTPNSGWPGRPRNIGIDAALGDYVFLSDHDDRLDPAALQRLADFADEHGSDVVVGKMVGVGRGAPVRIFERTQVDAQDDPGLLFTSLTPQKLYRRSFLDERDIRFPEGRRRLEDHLFVTKAYLRATRVSVYADHPVYYFQLRDDGRNASRRKVEWPGYFLNAAESIAVVDAEEPDEERRIEIRQRWLRVEAMNRVRGASLAGRDEVDRAVLVGAVRELLEQHYPLAEIDRLTTVDRIAARLILAGRDDDLLALAQWESTIRIRPRLETARLSHGELTVRFAAAKGATAPRPAFLDGLPDGWPGPDEVARIDALGAGARAVVTLRHAASGSTIEARTEQGVERDALHVVAAIPLGDVRAQGRWAVHVRYRTIGRTPGQDLLLDKREKASLARIRTRVGRISMRLGVGEAGRLLVVATDASPRSVLRHRVGEARRLVRTAPGGLLRRARRLASRARARLR